MELTKQQILENRKQQLNESLLSWENVLMAAGFIPVIGEIADIALIIYYLVKGEKLYAALMLIALVPVVGDFTVKPLIKMLRGAGKNVLRSTDDLAKVLTSNPKVAAEFQKAMKGLNHPGITKTLDNLSSINTSWGSKLKGALGDLGNLATRIKPVAALKSAATATTFRSGLKGFYQGERLAKYVAKRGVMPSKFVKDWWIPFAARADRRNSFRKFIMANNLLASLGVPTLSSFEDKMANDEKFREQVANDPTMSSYIAQNSSEANFQNQETDGGLGAAGSAFGGVMGLRALKLFANMYT
jgi:hypothetical protein